MSLKKIVPAVCLNVRSLALIYVVQSLKCRSDSRSCLHFMQALFITTTTSAPSIGTSRSIGLSIKHHQTIVHELGSIQACNQTHNLELQVSPQKVFGPSEPTPNMDRGSCRHASHEDLLKTGRDLKGMQPAGSLYFGPNSTCKRFMGNIASC